MDLVSGYGREAPGDQPSDDSRDPLEGVEDESPLDLVQLGSESVVIVGI
jgi:hypothetical protein